MTQVTLQQRQVHHVHSRLPLKQVALGPCGVHVVLNEDGTSSWSAGLPDHLLETLTERDDELKFVSLGRSKDVDETWYWKDNDGYNLVGGVVCKTLDNFWRSGSGDHCVDQVWFAPGGGYYLNKTGGAARWWELPDSLEKYLEKYWNSHDGVSSLSVGHNGEWFVKFGNRCYGDRGVHPALHNLLHKQQDMTGAVEWVELGPDGSFVALFEEHTVWFGDDDLTEAMYDVLKSSD